MPHGPSHCSITSEAPWRFDRLKLGQIEFNNRAQRLGERTFLLIVRQRLQPAGILGLQLHGRGDGIVPSLDPGAPVGGADSRFLVAVAPRNDNTDGLFGPDSSLLSQFGMIKPDYSSE